MTQNYILHQVKNAISSYQQEENMEVDIPISNIEVNATKQLAHGDYSTNAAMVLSKSFKTNPRVLAEKLVRYLKQDQTFASVDIAGPGFINFKLSSNVISNAIQDILCKKEKWAWIQKENSRNIHVEFVSVNPNGPVTIGSGRGAAYGDTLCRTLTASGEKVHREFYINDSTNSEQMRLFAESVKHHALKHLGIDTVFPEKGYKGDYVTFIGETIAKAHPDTLKQASIQWIQIEAQKLMIEWQKKDLSHFGVEFDTWFSEQSLHDTHQVQSCLDELKANGLAYEKDSALWLESTRFQDDKDRVLIRGDGRTTYVSSDAAYHKNKYQRGTDLVIDILGPDHHGYIGRMNAVIQALGKSLDQFKIIIYQVVRFVKNGNSVPMRKRDGTIYELGNFTTDIGVDNARFFFLMRSHDTHLDFDIDLAVKQSDENPVYYVQYAHARICSILEKAKILEDPSNEVHADLLTTDSEKNLIKAILELPVIIQQASEDYGVHRFAHYSIELARLFHSFYDKCKVIQEDEKELTIARIHLCKAVMYTFRSVFWILGISSPKHMRSSDSKD